MDVIIINAGITIRDSETGSWLNSIFVCDIGFSYRILAIYEWVTDHANPLMCHN